MGGRGSSGGGARVGAGGIAKLKMPEITSGSEKQISWARDIIEKPYNDLLSRYRVEERLREADISIAKKQGRKPPKPSADYEASKAAVNRYASEVSKISSVPWAKMNDAKWIIDHRIQFSQMGKEILNEEQRKRRR